MNRVLGTARSLRPRCSWPRVRFPPRAQLLSAGRVVHPSRPHKPAHVGSSPTPATFETRSPTLMVGWSGGLVSGSGEPTRGASLDQRGKNSAPADRGLHVCKSTVVWWDDRRTLPFKRRWRRTRSVPGRGPFESVERLMDQGGEAATQAPVKRPTAGSNPAPGARVPIGALAKAAAPAGRRPEVESLLRRSPRARVRWMDRSSSKRSPAGSSPAGRTRPRWAVGPVSRDRDARSARERGLGYEDRRAKTRNTASINVLGHCAEQHAARPMSLGSPTW